MSNILNEVLAANQKYSASYGARNRISLCHPHEDLPCSPAWTPASIQPNMRD